VIKEYDRKHFTVVFKKFTTNGLDKKSSFISSIRATWRGDGLLKSGTTSSMEFSTVDKNIVLNILYYMLKYQSTVLAFDTTEDSSGPLALIMSSTGIKDLSMLTCGVRPFNNPISWHASRNHAKLKTDSKDDFIPELLSIPFFALGGANIEKGKIGYEISFERFFSDWVLEQYGVVFEKIQLNN